MKIFTSFEELPKTKVALTIGSFDGVHTGHQTLLKKLKSYGVPTAVLTFPEHPLQTLCPPPPVPICSLKTRLSLLEKQGIDWAIVIPFPSVMNHRFDEFLNLLPISHLVLGEGAAFGRHREGSQANVEAWGKSHGVEIAYISKVKNISSSQIRAAIAAKNFALAQTLLGHNNYEKNHVKH